METKRRKSITQSLKSINTLNSHTSGYHTLEPLCDALIVQPSNRTSKENQIILKYLLRNKKIMRIIGSEENAERIINEATFIQLTKNQVLYFEGDDSDGWYVILDGEAEVVVRFFLIAEDCSFEFNENESNYDLLMEQMDLDKDVDKLIKVRTIHPHNPIGYQSFFLTKKRSETILCTSDTLKLIKFLPNSYQIPSIVISAKTLLEEQQSLTSRKFPRLRTEQTYLISTFSEVIEIEAGKTISDASSLGNYLYIIKNGTISQFRIIDFTSMSFRKIDSLFESLEINFPDGKHPVHIGDMKVGDLFADPSIKMLTNSLYKVKTITKVQLLAIDFEYFRIVAGAVEVEKLKIELKNNLSEKEVLDIWVKEEKKKKWEKFKKKEVKESHKEFKGDKLAKSSMVAIRVPKAPKPIKIYKPKKIISYAPRSLI